MVISRGVLQLLPREEPAASTGPSISSSAPWRRTRSTGRSASSCPAPPPTAPSGWRRSRPRAASPSPRTTRPSRAACRDSAIATGCVDFVLPPAEIAGEIGRIARHPYVAPAAPARRKAHAGEPDLSEILQILRKATGRRLHPLQGEHPLPPHHPPHGPAQDGGLAGLRALPAEEPRGSGGPLPGHPHQRHELLPRPGDVRGAQGQGPAQLLKDRSRHEPVRVWVLGCSTGEEAYSLAIAFAEFAEATGSRLPVQIFATDLNGAGIEKARAGVYPKNIAHDVSPERLRRFFAEVDGSYRISKSIRDMCVFARHNVLTDPPFSRLDLISCRNLLIYLEPALQKKIVPLLHYALKPAGFLVLGSSETIGSYRDLFEVGGRQAQDLRQETRHPPGDPRPGRRLHRGRGELGHGPGRLPQAADRDRRAERGRPHPPGEICPARRAGQRRPGDPAVPRGHRPYLAPAPGKASLNLLKMAREGLAVALRAAIDKARKEQAPVREEGLRVKSDGGSREVNLEVVPVKGSSAGTAASWSCSKSPPQPSPARHDGRARAPKPQARAAAAERSRRARERPPGAGAGRHPRVPAIGDRAAGSRQRRAAVRQRGGAVGQRGAAEHQRGAGDLQGGDPVEQRRAGHGQRRAAEPQRGAEPAQQRPGQPARQRPDGHRHARAGPARPALHADGGKAVQPDPHRHRPADQRHQAQPQPPRSGAVAGGGDRHGQPQGTRGPGQAGALVLAAHPAVQDPGEQDRRRGDHARRHRHAAARPRICREHRGDGARAPPGAGRGPARADREPVFLPNLPGHARRDGAPLSLRARQGQWNIPELRRLLEEILLHGQRRRRLRGGTRVRAHRPEDHAAQRPAVLSGERPEGR